MNEYQTRTQLKSENNNVTASGEYSVPAAKLEFLFGITYQCLSKAISNQKT